MGASSPSAATLVMDARVAPILGPMTTYHRAVPGFYAPAVDIIRLVLGSPGTSAIMEKKAKSDPPPAGAGGALHCGNTNCSCPLSSFS